MLASSVCFAASTHAPRPRRAEVREALRGHISSHHRFMLKRYLAQIDALDQAIAAIEKEVGPGLEPFRQSTELPSTMPGLSAVSASVLVAEIGVDMSRFKTPGHLLSWGESCGLAIGDPPVAHETGGLIWQDPWSDCHC
jgi:transposase